MTYCVAADKGTATFSDFANSVSLDRNFWLGDGFASGGQYGYDHKKVGITAKGAWECTKLHFKSMQQNPEKDPIKVVAIGDMSGDVFGNGMLLSKSIQLVAAFNHMHIFIDPSPKPATAGKNDHDYLNYHARPGQITKEYPKAGVFTEVQKKFNALTKLFYLIYKKTASQVDLIKAI